MTFKEKRERGLDPKDKRVVMTIEDVSAALGEYGVNVKKPRYYAEHSDVGRAPEGGGGTGAASKAAGK